MDHAPINPFDEEDKAGRRQVIFVTLGLGVMCLLGILGVVVFIAKPDPQALIGQYFPSPTSTPPPLPTRTPTLTPTPTRTPSPTLDLTATAQIVQASETALAYQTLVENAATNWEAVLSDMFDSNQNNWLVEESDDEYSLTKYEVVDGIYRWDVTAHQPFIGWVRGDKELLTDFYLSVDARQVEGADTADYGVIFREDDNSNFYYFGISDQGAYVLYMYYEEWVTMIDWTDTDLIKPGDVNRIAVLGEGSHFTFFINDRYLIDITDETIPSGNTALAVELAEENDRAVFEFDNFELRAP